MGMQHLFKIKKFQISINWILIQALSSLPTEGPGTSFQMAVFVDFF